MNTPRPTRLSIPLPTRSTDVRMLGECAGAWFLQHVREDEIQDASYFQLGSILHSTIERSIIEDLDLNQALALASSQVDGWLANLGDSAVVQTKTRTLETMRDDAERMVRSWYRWVHPDSEDRLEIFDSYQYPPRTEVSFTRTDPDLEYPIWGRADAIFDPKPGTNLAPLLIDWKSSQRRNRDHGAQLHFYQYGLQLPEADAAYLYLDRSRRSDALARAEPYPGDRVIRRRVRQAIREKQGILSQKRANFSPGPHCGSCIAKPLCPVRGPKKARAANMKRLRADLQLVQPLEHIELGVPA